MTTRTIKQWTIDRQHGHVRMVVIFSDGHRLIFLAASRNNSGKSGLGSVFLNDKRGKELVHFQVCDNNAHDFAKKALFKKKLLGEMWLIVYRYLHNLVEFEGSQEKKVLLAWELIRYDSIHAYKIK